MPDMPLPRKSLAQLLRASCQNFGDKPAVVGDQNTYSFLDVDTLSDMLAAALQSRGLRRGGRVVVCVGNRIETIIAFWATLKAGGVIVNIGLETSVENVGFILGDAEPDMLITTAEKYAGLSASMASRPYLRAAILVDAGADHAGPRFTDLLQPGQLRDPGVIDLDLAAIIYTSGSTGEPKGVMLTHRNMIAALDSLHAYLGYRSSDRVLCALPLSFDYGLYQMLMCLSCGATLVLSREFLSPLFMIKRIRQHNVSVLPVVPTMLALLHEYSHRHGMTFDSVRMVTNTGAALSQAHIGYMRQLFPVAQIFSMYGLTECKRCTYLPPDDIERKPDSVGIAIPNTELWLVDDKGKRIDAPGTIGQLVIRGATVMAGYWRNQEETVRKLRPGPYAGEMVLYTGDYCSLDEEGYLYFRGRMDHVIKSRGMKVSPVEVEQFLLGIDGIESAAVVGVEDRDSGEGLCAFVKTMSGFTLLEDAILDICRQKLAAHKVPNLIKLVDELPRTANGKIDLLKLKHQAASAD